MLTNERIIISGYGEPEVLMVIHEPLPQPGSNEVRIKVQAAGISYADKMMRKGLYAGTPPVPFTPGYDVVGIIDSLGANVTKNAVGERVAALTMVGGYSKYICIDANQLVKVPENVDSAEAVSLILNYTSAYQMLKRIAKVEAGDQVLIHGASGGVGTAMLDLARHLGLKAFGTVSKEKKDVVFDYSATPIDYRNENFLEVITKESPKGLNAVFDPIGNENWTASYRCIRRGGTLVGYGWSSSVDRNDSKVGAILKHVFKIQGMNFIPDGKKASMYSVTTLKKKHPNWFQEDLTHLFELLEKGEIKPCVSHRIPLTDAALAHQLMEKSQSAGKMVLVC